MVSRKKKTVPPTVKEPASAASSKGCRCGDNCHEDHSHLPGYLLIAFGLLALPINFGLISGLEWAKAWPLLLVLVGATLVAKVTLCKAQSS
jgi:hypothetical protein